ncbi:hypothetical protein CEXT_456281 [Caerostris extrusa]|uniref:Uncharacterized protein n=1 Tax=Caerostris extrusa TaxID=172846 RepID=A0AAV4N9T6_CAEEX|nr:hypothetical protein CEXT_456281 [Caerostris extrusa]
MVNLMADIKIIHFLFIFLQNSKVKDAVQVSSICTAECLERRTQRRRKESPSRMNISLDIIFDVKTIKSTAVVRSSADKISIVVLSMTFFFS